MSGLLSCYSRLLRPLEEVPTPQVVHYDSSWERYRPKTSLSCLQVGNIWPLSTYLASRRRRTAVYRSYDKPWCLRQLSVVSFEWYV